MASQQQSSYTPAELRNLWRTPQWLFDYLDSHFKFNVDLAANVDNTKCDMHLTEQINSLKFDWYKVGKVGWLNPPYDDITPWIDKAIMEADRGFTTVMLVNCFNGQDIWKKIYDNAEVINIIGRISFLAGASYVVEKTKGNNRFIEEGQPVPGNTAGSSVLIFGAVPIMLQNIKYLIRDEMK